MKRRSRSVDFSRARRGAVVPVPSGKTRITIRIDTDILDWFRERIRKAHGGSYQTDINEALRAFINSRDGHAEELFRRVLREELLPYEIRNKKRNAQAKRSRT